MVIPIVRVVVAVAITIPAVLVALVMPMMRATVAGLRVAAIIDRHRDAGGQRQQLSYEKQGFEHGGATWVEVNSP